MTNKKPHEETTTEAPDLEDKLAAMSARIEALTKAEADREHARVEALRRAEIQAQIDQRQAELDQLEAAELARMDALEAEEAKKQEAAKVTKLQKQHPRVSELGDAHPAIRLRRLYG